MTKYAAGRTMRTPPRAHIHAVLMARRFVRARWTVAVDEMSADIAVRTLTGTRTSNGGGKRPEQDPEIEPERPVPDVIRVPRFLARHVGHRALAHLSHPAEPWTHLMPERAEVGAELREVVVRERPGTDQAHVAGDDVPELGQLVDAEPAQPPPDVRDHARVVQELHARVPLEPGLGMIRQVGDQALLSIGHHRPKLPDADPSAAQPRPLLAVERRARADQLDGDGGHGDHGRADHED